MRGQDARCTDKEREKATEKVTELTNIVNQCLIRRTNQILTKYLPVKFEMVICVKLSRVQMDIYRSFLASDSVRKTVLGKIITSTFSIDKLFGRIYIYNDCFLLISMTKQLKMKNQTV